MYDLFSTFRCELGSFKNRLIEHALFADLFCVCIRTWCDKCLHNTLTL